MDFALINHKLQEKTRYLNFFNKELVK